MEATTADEPEKQRQPRGLRRLAIGVSAAKLAPPLIAVIWLVVIQLLSLRDPVDCGDDPLCGEGQSFWLFLVLIIGTGLLIGGVLFGAQVFAAFQRSPVWLFAVGLLLSGVDVSVLGFILADAFGQSASPGVESVVVLAYVGVVAALQLAVGIWAGRRVLARERQPARPSGSDGSTEPAEAAESADSAESAESADSAELR